MGVGGPPCPACKGKGWNGSTFERTVCLTCSGAGVVIVVDPSYQMPVEEAVARAKTSYEGNPDEPMPYDLEDIGKNFWATQLALWLIKRHPVRHITCPSCGRRSGRTWDWSITIKMSPHINYDTPEEPHFDIRYEVLPVVEGSCFTCINAITPDEMQGMHNAVRIWAEEELNKFFRRGLHPGFKSLIDLQRKFLVGPNRELPSATGQR